MHAVEFYVRIVLAALWFLVSCSITLLLLPFRWRDPSLATVFARILAWGGMPIMGLRLRVDGQAKLYLHQPCVYVANHQSNLDLFTIAGMYPYRTVVIGKTELRWIPLFGLLFLGTGNILIRRQDRMHSLAGLEQARKWMIDHELSIWMFPEGTRNRGAPEMRPFKKGAFHLAIAAQVPIVPIVHQHLYSYLDVAARRVHRGEILIRVLDPTPTKGLRVSDVAALMTDVRARMEAALRAPDMRPAPAPAPKELT